MHNRECHLGGNYWTNYRSVWQWFHLKIGQWDRSCSHNIFLIYSKNGHRTLLPDRWKNKCLASYTKKCSNCNITWLDCFWIYFFLSILNLSIDFAGETLSVVRMLKNWLNLVCHLDCNSSALSLILVAATHLEIGHIECLIFKWVATTSLKWYGTGVVAPAVVVGQHGPFFGCAVTVNGCFTFQSMLY